MMAEGLESCQLSWHGVAGDRRWAFVRTATNSRGFPWQTIRENPMMCRYGARFLDRDRPESSTVTVTTPTGADRLVTDPALAEELGPGVQAMQVRRGNFDSMTLSLVTTATVASLCALAGVAAEPLRFRPNLLVAPVGGEPYAEDQWIDRVLQIGDAVLRVDRRDTRCTVVNVDPATGERDAALLRVVASERQSFAGVYGTCQKPGLVNVGDPVTVVH